MVSDQKTSSMAVFCDFENVAIGAREAKYADFNIGKVLERLLVKGNIVVKKAYCDWGRYQSFKRSMHEAAFELIDIPHVRQSGKNSADIRMVVDALDLCYTKEHVDTFVIVSGDSDFSPLVSKLRENNKIVIGVGVKHSTSDLFISNCDDFIFYDDLVREGKPRAKRATSSPSAKSAKSSTKKNGKSDESKAEDGKPEDSKADDGERDTGRTGGNPDEAVEEIIETLDKLTEERGEDDTIWGSMVKQALKRRLPGFNERFYGYRSFNALLEEVAKRGAIKLKPDEKSGGYTVQLVEK